MAKFVVALDEDEVSAYAFTWAVKNLFKPGDHVNLVSATFSDASLPSADITAGEFAVPLAPEVEDIAAISARATVLIDKYMKQCEQASLKSEGKVVDGSPGPQIVAEGERLDADALVVGTHGKGVIGRTLLGSVSDYVRHHSNLPVVLVRFPKGSELGALESSGEPRKVVAAVDETAEAGHAFSWLLAHFLRDEDHLVVLHVQNPVAQPTAAGTANLGMEDVYVPPDTTGKASVEALQASEKLVELFMKQAADGTKAKCEGRVVSGATQDKLLQELSEHAADVVVLGSHAHDLLQRTFLGSVSDFLAHNSPCPVIFIKPSTGVKPPVEGKAHNV